MIIPERWRNVNNANAMADSVYAYTKDLMIALKNAGATPDMVQVGNETTPGILIHKPNSKTDCWGNGVDKAATSVNGDMGTSAGKANAAKYFNAGIKAVKEVSPTTKTVLRHQGGQGSFADNENGAPHRKHPQRRNRKVVDGRYL